MLKLMERVETPDGRRGRVVCLTGGRALVWYGFKKGEVWWEEAELQRSAPRQLELFA